jgi:Tol biopolymer transport system component
MQRRTSVIRWLAPVVTLAVCISIFGCVSTPQKPRETLAFTRAPQRGGTDTVWIMKDDGSGQAQLDLGADGNRSITWSPDGNDIAFESVRDGNPEIYTARLIVDGDGGYSAQDITRRTSTASADAFPAWSQDCALIAFSSNRDNRNYYTLYQLDLGKKNVAPITSGNYEDSSPSWSPDGTKIAFARTVENASREIYVHMMGSGQNIRLTNNTVNDSDPSWSPSGRIIFARHSEDGSRAALFEMDSVDANGDGNGDHLTAMSTPAADQYDQQPQYSPSGKAIVFFRSQEAGGGGPGDTWKIIIQDGTIMEPVVNLTQSKLQHEHGAAWMPKGACARNGK